jgi:hypothetical protein
MHTHPGRSLELETAQVMQQRGAQGGRNGAVGAVTEPNGLLKQLVSQLGGLQDQREVSFCRASSASSYDARADRPTRTHAQHRPAVRWGRKPRRWWR